MPKIPAPRQEDCLKFRADLDYMACSRSPRAVKENSVSKNQKEKRKDKIMCDYHSKL